MSRSNFLFTFLFFFNVYFIFSLKYAPSDFIRKSIRSLLLVTHKGWISTHRSQILHTPLTVFQFLSQYSRETSHPTHLEIGVVGFQVRLAFFFGIKYTLFFLKEGYVDKKSENFSKIIEFDLILGGFQASWTREILPMYDWRSRFRFFEYFNIDVWPRNTLYVAIQAPGIKFWLLKVFIVMEGVFRLILAFEVKISDLVMYEYQEASSNFKNSLGLTICQCVDFPRNVNFIPRSCDCIFCSLLVSRSQLWAWILVGIDLSGSTRRLCNNPIHYHKKIWCPKPTSLGLITPI